MAVKRLKRPRDPLQLAKLVVDIATGQVEDRAEDAPKSAAAEMGAKGGTARAAALPAKRRKEIAAKAAKARWKASSDA
jgi:hypothetical protein